MAFLCLSSLSLLLFSLSFSTRSIQSYPQRSSAHHGPGRSLPDDGPFGIDSLPRLAADTEKADRVRAAMKHAWDNYVKYAWGSDELNPIARRGTNGFGGLGCTIVDSLSTLKIMNLEDEFNEGKEWVRQHLDFGKLDWVSLFETNIRFLGGLLSAYGLSNDPIFLEKAKDLGTRFLPAFHPVTGYATNDINLRNGDIRPRGSVSLAEIGTLQLEMLYLSYLTKDPKYAVGVMKTLRTLDAQKTNINHGLGSQSLDREHGVYRHDRWTLGAMADSYYEYLIKLHLFTGQDSRYGFRRMWDEAAEKIRVHSLRPAGSNFYVGEIHNSQTNNVMDHLACFTGGMFGLAAATEKDKDAKHNRNYDDLAIGEGIAHTCVTAYDSTATGLGAEVFTVDGDGRTHTRVHHNILRPETVESLYVLYRLTGKQEYRDMGWRIFQAFQKHTKVDSGYSGIHDVERVPVSHDGKQQSFFMAETLKYLYLLFTSDDVISLDEYVFNTEAHPFPIPTGVWDGVECMFPSADTTHPICTSFDGNPTWPETHAGPLRNRRERGRGREREREREVEKGEDEDDDRLARRRRLRLRNL